MSATVGPTIVRPCGCTEADIGAGVLGPWKSCPSCGGAGTVTVEVHPFVTLESAVECLQSLRISLGIIGGTDKITPKIGTPAYYWDGVDEGLRSLFQQLVVMLPEEYERTEGSW